MDSIPVYWIVTYVAYLVTALAGIVLNIVLLVVFFKHPEARRPESVPLINLCFVDIVYLLNPFINFFLSYNTRVNPYLACIFLLFYSSFVISLNTYSIASISIQRYVGLYRFKNHLPEEKTNYLHSRLIVLGVWVLAAISATAVVVLERCSHIGGSYGEPTFRLVIDAVVPTSIMAVFYIIPACKMRTSFNELRIEKSIASVQDRRTKITRIFIALAIFFAVSKLSLIIVSWILENFIPITQLWAVIYGYIQLCYILNPVFNPIVLCVASSELRKLYKIYCCCCCKEKRGSEDDNNINTTIQETQLSRL